MGLQRVRHDWETFIHIYLAVPGLRVQLCSCVGRLVVAHGIIIFFFFSCGTWDFLIALQCCVAFCSISHNYIYISPHSWTSPTSLHPTSVGHDRAQAGLPVLHGNLAVACKVSVAACGSSSLTRGGTRAPCIGSTNSAPGPPGRPQYIMLTDVSEYSTVSVMNKYWFYIQENTPKNSSYS